MATINCTVDGCIFWENGNVCGAGEITVAAVSRQEGRRDMEVGRIGAVDRTKPVLHSHHTQCVTFKPKQQRQN